MNLRAFTDESLLQQTKNLVAREREIAIDILHHLKEIERRRLFLDRGYPTLWAYMTQELRYSESAAQRRIEALRALKEIPELEAKIASGALSLSNVAKLQSTARRADKAAQEPISQTEKKLAIFEELENKTQKEAEQIVAKHYPEVAKPKDRARPLNATQTALRVTVSHEVMVKIERVKNLLSHKNPNASLAELLELMADFVIAKKDLSREKSSVKDLSHEKCSVKDGSQKKDDLRADLLPQRQLQPRSGPPKRKYLPMPVRRQVWQKAKGCCEYQDDQTQKRCQATHLLEVEHIQPVAFGGGDQIQNLQLLCRAHNQHNGRAATLIL